eukprot:scaffold259889_cov24-Tisochrysis_lutea.AAC.7
MECEFTSFLGINWPEAKNKCIRILLYWDRRADTCWLVGSMLMLFYVWCLERRRRHAQRVRPLVDNPLELDSVVAPSSGGAPPLVRPEGLCRRGYRAVAYAP